MYRIVTTVSGYISYRGKMYPCRPDYWLQNKIDGLEKVKASKPKGELRYISDGEVRMRPNVYT